MSKGPQSTNVKLQTAARYLYDNTLGKPKELKIVRGFLDRLQLHPDTVDSSERPDFLVAFTHPPMSIGLELTQLNADAGERGSPERRLHSEWKRLAEKLRSKLQSEADPLPHTYGSVFFKKDGPGVLDGINRDQFCDEIVKALKGVPLSPSGSQIDRFDPHDTPQLARVVEHLFVRLFPLERDFLWWCSHLQSGHVYDPVQAIRNIVVEKRRIAANYDWRSATKRWLLIYAAGEGLADLAAFPKNPRVRSHKPFDDIFLWDKFSETISVLSPSFKVLFENGQLFYINRIPPWMRTYVKQWKEE